MSIVTPSLRKNQKRDRRNYTMDTILDSDQDV
jgi:hypothetical protein